MPKHQSFCWYSERPFPRPLVDKLQMHPYINLLSMKNTSDIYQPLRSRQSQSSGILKEMICTLFSMPLLVFLIKTNRVKYSILEAYRSFHIRQRLCWHIRGCFPGEGNYKDCTACHRICKRRFDMKLLLDRDWNILHE